VSEVEQAIEQAIEQVRILAAEVERLRNLQFEPSGDNHHNAALCPYCGEPLRKALAEVERLKAENEELSDSYREANEFIGDYVKEIEAIVEPLEELLATAEVVRLHGDGDFIEITASWTGGVPLPFSGMTLTEVLAAANNARKEAEGE
jgi:FtsZ-binding cell division protein ZapB